MPHACTRPSTRAAAVPACPDASRSVGQCAGHTPPCVNKHRLQVDGRMCHGNATAVFTILAVTSPRPVFAQLTIMFRRLTANMLFAFCWNWKMSTTRAPIRACTSLKALGKQHGLFFWLSKYQRINYGMDGLLTWRHTWKSSGWSQYIVHLYRVVGITHVGGRWHIRPSDATWH